VLQRRGCERSVAYLHDWHAPAFVNTREYERVISALKHLGYIRSRRVDNELHREVDTSDDRLRL
jgi:predicted alpha/beta hydrolase